MEKSAMEVMVESITKTKAEYPSVLMHKKRWLEVINEIERLKAENTELKKRPLFDTGSVFGREQMVIAGLRAKGF